MAKRSNQLRNYQSTTNLIDAAKVATIPVHMSDMSPIVKQTIDAITANANSAAYHPASAFATPSQGTKADSALQSVDLSGLVTKTTAVNGHALSANVTVSKSDVGLGNVDNTADSAKPVSGPQQTALNLKANTSAISAVGLSGAYNDLSNKPTLGTASTQAIGFFATAAQGLLAETALQSIDLSDYATIENVAVVTAYVDTEIGLLSDEIDTELELKANASDMQSQFDALQESYDTLNNNFLCLLKWSIITFGQVPEGLESYIEPALNTE